ncbi:hypothetical protein [Lonsdalea quercina]|uniref:hypothetical protein n=1 Tax=Lonsdalea quercina TaxID=71657 RepID=UPI0039748F6A
MTAEIWVKNKNLLQNRVVGQGDFCAKHVLYLHDISSSVGARTGAGESIAAVGRALELITAGLQCSVWQGEKVKKAEKMQYLFLRPSLLIRLGSTS